MISTHHVHPPAGLATLYLWTVDRVTALAVSSSSISLPPYHLSPLVYPSHRGSSRRAPSHPLIPILSRPVTFIIYHFLSVAPSLPLRLKQYQAEPRYPAHHNQLSVLSSRIESDTYNHIASHRAHYVGSSRIVLTRLGRKNCYGPPLGSEIYLHLHCITTLVLVLSTLGS